MVGPTKVKTLNNLQEELFNFGFHNKKKKKEKTYDLE